MTVYCNWEVVDHKELGKRVRDANLRQLELLHNLQTGCAGHVRIRRAAEELRHLLAHVREEKAGELVWLPPVEPGSRFSRPD